MGSVQSAAKEAKQTRDFDKLKTIFNDTNKPFDFFKIVADDNHKGLFALDFIGYLLSDPGIPEETLLSLLRIIKQRISDQQQPQKANKNNINQKKLPQLYSYLDCVVLYHPTDVELFTFVLDEFNCFDLDLHQRQTSSSSPATEKVSPPPPTPSPLHFLSSTPDSIELLRVYLSSGDNKLKNNEVSNDDMKKRTGRTPLERACQKLYVEGVHELCVARAGGNNFEDCLKALLVDHAPSVENADEKASEIILALLSQRDFNKEKILYCNIAPKDELFKFFEKYIIRFEEEQRREDYDYDDTPRINRYVGYALHHELPKTASVLVNNGCKPFKRGRRPQLELVCSSTTAGDAEITMEMKIVFAQKKYFRWILDFDAVINDEGDNLLEAAIRTGKTGLARALSDCGAVVKKKG